MIGHIGNDLLSQPGLPKQSLGCCLQTKSNCNHLTTHTQRLQITTKLHTKINPTNLKPGLGALYAISPRNGSGLFYSSMACTRCHNLY